MPRLENWAIAQTADPYRAPETKRSYLIGTIYDRQGFEDGTDVRTSSLIKLNIREKIAETRNTVYELGKPSVQFLDWLESEGYTLEDYEL